MISPARVGRQQALLQAIATNPGQSRADLAARFFLSERQVQEDLRGLRTGTFLAVAEVEVVRDRGYRFRIKVVDSVEPVPGREAR